MTRHLFIILMALAVLSCEQGNTDRQVGHNADSQALLQKENDSLRSQLALYKDTVIEQRERLERIKTILEPLIQQEDDE